jgi:hypothetical protein
MNWEFKRLGSKILPALWYTSSHCELRPGQALQIFRLTVHIARLSTAVSVWLILTALFPSPWSVQVFPLGTLNACIYRNNPRIFEELQAEMDCIINSIKGKIKDATVQCFVLRLHRVMQSGNFHSQIFPAHNCLMHFSFINTFCNTVQYLWT